MPGFTQFNIVLPEEKRAVQNEYLMKAGVSVFPFNPMLVIEDSKVHFAFTKEISVVIGSINLKHKSILNRIGAEYSYIFRDVGNHHFRLFYSLDYPAYAGDFAAISLSPGLGYFTDFKKSGAFPQLSTNIFIPVEDNFAVNLYLKARHSFIFQKNEKDLTDISLGLGLIFLL
ncbi:MAG: hypothetical protein JW917_07400 [Ignavibacteria bacterium]|nr:hypothetical protein [Ignavibacteria bacterium]